MSAHLSICIPTYNYGAFVATAIQSVFADPHPGIEIVVLDGGSTDTTKDVVQKLAAGRPFVKYVHQSERGGIDSDLSRCVELASGEYCWLLSADDALVPGAIQRILKEFERGYDVLLANRIWCDANLNPQSTHAWLTGDCDDCAVDFSDADQMVDYLDRARSLGALFSFMSVIGFRRERWLRTQAVATLIGSNYAHVQRLFSMARTGTGLRYIAEPLVLCRGGHDSFREGGLASRLAIDLRGYWMLSQVIFPNDPAMQEAFRAVVTREHPWPRWVRARGDARDTAQWKEVERLLSAYGYNRAQLMALNALGALSKHVLPSAA